MSEVNSIENISIEKIAKAIKYSFKGIIIFVLSVTIITAAINYIILKPVYECKTSININIPVSVNTQHGEYRFPTVDPLDYSFFFKNQNIAEKTISDLNIDIDAEDLIDRLNFKIAGETRNNVSATRTMTITYKSNTAKDSDIILNKYAQNFIETFLINLKIEAINDSISQTKIRFETNQIELLIKQQILHETLQQISETNEFVTLKYIMTADNRLFLKYMEENSLDISTVDDEVLFTEIINPAYENLLRTKTDVLREIAYVNGEISKLQNHQDRLNIEYDAVQLYNTEQDNSGLDNKYMNVMENRITITKFAEEPESPVSPNKIKNILVIAFLSIVISFLAVLVKFFWRVQL